MKKFIETEGLAIFGLFLLLIVQVAFTVYVFNKSGHHADMPWLAYVYAIGVDVAVLIFAVHGRILISFFFYFASLATNTVYLYYPDSIISQTLIAFMLSTTIFSYTHLFVWISKKREEELKTNKSLNDAALLAEAKKLGIEIIPLPYKCPVCGEGFANSKKLNGHISAHKTKNQWEVENKNWEKENMERAAFVSKLTFE
jgi:hypothetical protein